MVRVWRACALAFVVGLAVGAGTVRAQRRPPSQRACPAVAPDGEVCTRYGQGRMCRYGRSICLCRRVSAREHQLHWYCSN